MARNNGLFGSGVSLLGGAAIGAALMYLFDPETGEERREDFGARTGDALGKAGAALGVAGTSAMHGLHGTSEAAGGAWTTLAAKARDLAASLGAHASDASGAGGAAAGRAASALSDWASRAGSSARSTARDAYDAGGDYARGLRARDVDADAANEGTIGTAAIGGGVFAAVGLGIAAVYFLDSVQGQARRDKAMELINGIVKNTGDMARQAGQRLNPDPSRASGAPVDYASSDQYMDNAPEVGRTDTGSATSASFNPQGT